MATNDFLSDIWNQILDGQSAAWRQLVESLAPLVYTVAHRAGLNRRDAEDCAQQTWLDLYRSRHTVDHPERLPAWLIRVVTRKASRIRRRRTRENEVHRDLEAPAKPAAADDLLEHLENLARLTLALDQMDARCRKLLHEVFFAQHTKSYADIARELGMPVNSLGPTRSRCLAKLRKILESME